MSCEKPQQKEYKRKTVCMCLTESLCYTAEAGTTLGINCTSTSKTQFKMIFNKKVLKDHHCNSLLEKSMKTFLVLSHVWTEFML